MADALEIIIASLSPLERKVVPHLSVGSLEGLQEKTGLDTTTLLRALEFLSHKDLITITRVDSKMIDVAVNGIRYRKEGLPERRLLSIFSDVSSVPFTDVRERSGLSDNEFRAALGVLKKKAFIQMVNGTLLLHAARKQIVGSLPEEQFLASLPRDMSSLSSEEKEVYALLRARKQIVDVKDTFVVTFQMTKKGRDVVEKGVAEAKDMVEAVTPQLIQSGNWKGKHFRRYDIQGAVPRVIGGKRHFVNQATDYARKIWLEMGFKEMNGGYVVSSFWNFDALFTAQDHPVRAMQDTFFISDGKASLPNTKTVAAVKKAHEGGVGGSVGWQAPWDASESTKAVLRTHTTCLSAQTLHEIAAHKEFPAKYFALGKCFRNETVDWSHGFEFNQTEGIVVDEHANFRQLLGYLTEFFRKMGYEKIRVRPGYFPYTEPSLEIDIFHPMKKKWVELGGAGMFRPEVTIPVFGRHIPVLAWGPGFDRIIMEFFAITDLRDMYKNDINQLRSMRVWDK